MSSLQQLKLKGFKDPEVLKEYKKYCKELDKVFKVSPRTSPDRLIPNFAKLYGIPTSVVEDYCTSIHLNDKVPRGADKKLTKLRSLLLDKIKSM